MTADFSSDLFRSARQWVRMCLGPIFLCERCGQVLERRFGTDETAEEVEHSLTGCNGRVAEITHAVFEAAEQETAGEDRRRLYVLIRQGAEEGGREEAKRAAQREQEAAMLYYANQDR